MRARARAVRKAREAIARTEAHAGAGADLVLGGPRLLAAGADAVADVAERREAHEAHADGGHRGGGRGRRHGGRGGAEERGRDEAAGRGRRLREAPLFDEGGVARVVRADFCAVGRCLREADGPWERVGRFGLGRVAAATSNGAGRAAVVRTALAATLSRHGRTRELRQRSTKAAHRPGLDVGA